VGVGVNPSLMEAWEGTPSEGASWLRTQKLADIWRRILIIPVVGGVVVRMLHTVTDAWM
jgi:hypothetical protein